MSDAAALSLLLRAGAILLLLGHLYTPLPDRAIALPAGVFRSLAALNHLGAGTFGIALVGLLAMSPRRLFRPVWRWIHGCFSAR